MTTQNRSIIYRAIVTTLANGDTPSMPGPLWEEFFEAAEAQRVLPFVAQRLSSQAAILPVRVQERLAGIVREHRQSAFWFSAELQGLLAALSATAIDVIPLKGPCYSERIYGGAHLRAIRDLDILVRRSQLAAARQLLGELGFQLHRTDCEYHETWARASTVVELHWDVAEKALFDFDIETAWQRASPGIFHGEPLLLFHPRDELLFICLHGTRHGFENLGLVLDVALLLDSIAANETCVDLQLRPEVRPLAGVLALGCELAQGLRPGKPLPFPAPWQAQDYRRLRRMVNEHWLHLSTGCSMEKSWPQLRRFYRSTLPTWPAKMSRCLHDVRDGFHLVVDGDDAWAGKIGAQYRISWVIRLLRFRRNSAAS